MTCRDITKNQSKHVGTDGRLRYDADDSEVFRKTEKVPITLESAAKALGLTKDQLLGK